MSEPTLEPDVDDVLQAEPTNEPAVKVKVEGPVRTQPLPRKGGATFTKTVSQTVPVQLLRADPRRRIATLSAADDFYVSFTESGIQAPATCYRNWGHTNIIVEAVTDVWVLAASATIQISVLTELWAMGDGEA